jgi:hypothetical protein
MVCPVSEIISEGNVGLLLALNRFEPGKRFSLCQLCGVLDQVFDTGLHSAFVVTCENRHHRKPEAAFFQTWPGETQNLCKGKSLQRKAATYTPIR